MGNAVSFQLAEDEERLAKNVVFQRLNHISLWKWLLAEH
jgi:hypothetical protein